MHARPAPPMTFAEARNRLFFVMLHLEGIMIARRLAPSRYSVRLLRDWQHLALFPSLASLHNRSIPYNQIDVSVELRQV